MKNKFLIFTLCFTIIFTNINFTYAYNDDDYNLKPLSLSGLVVAPEIIATIGSIAVASGIVLNSTDDIYDITRLVYDNIKEQNKNIATVFQSSVVLLSSGAVKVGKDFLDICKSAFDTSFSSTTKEDVVTNVTYLKGIPVISDLSANISKFANVCFISDKDFTLCGYSFKYLKTDTINMTTRHYFDIYYPSGELYKSNLGIRTANNYIYRYFIKPISGGYQYMISYGYPNSSGGYNYSNVTSLPYVTANDYGYVIPFAPGSYTWDNLNDKLNDDESVDIYVPGNADSLVGLPSGGTLSNPSYDLPFGGTVTLPGVNNPSLDVGDNIVIPGIDVDVPDVDVPDVDVPSDTPFANITEYIIGLVVPSDSFWTDTFNGFRTNFINAFPMVDMSGFNNLIVEGKPFPNIDIKIMGSKGRVVNGDTVNSIVDWLRPIIAGFIFLCLMFFNYRKLYKLIRNSEPFEGIGKVENHAN